MINVILKQIEKILNAKGFGIRIIPTGNAVYADFKHSIEINPLILNPKNNQFEIGTPLNKKIDSDGNYIITRIRIPSGLVKDYEKGHPYSDEEIEKFLLKNDTIFAYFDKV